ncbi:4'-phosphopantetheinyl transferase superfamily protein [Streptomyces sp. SID5643]|uniref:4'-phosphopantetheinyl transferase family protein n=1 Tax=Streptomyces sp. SID5643 TaxID=2690307 RepID=UPI00136A9E32|nr:4'-phosphopantetheinyl transferase superfamily protein [Streptomyces sp. SID5643]MZF84753.1 4'-phosphopantetheinyl transferase superfamily protein [Streptomyces sp. SID5643]
MKTREITPGVWVAASSSCTGPLTPADRSAARGAPVWRARQLLAGRALLRSLLAQVAPQAADAAVTAGDNGKPALDRFPGLGISISHDETRTAVSVASGRLVGVDIQIPPNRVDPALLRRCAHRYADRLDRLPPSVRSTLFTEIWTVQEACVKTTGSGIGGRPWSIDVPPHREDGSWRGLRWHKVRGLADVPVACAWEGD